MSRKSPGRESRLAGGLALALLTAAIVGGVTAPAQAADGHPTITVTDHADSSVHGGTLADLGSSPAHNFDVNVAGLTCATTDGGFAANPQLGMFLVTPQITSAADLDPDNSATSLAQLHALTINGLQGTVNPATGVPNSGIQGLFPSSGWSTPDGGIFGTQYANLSDAWSTNPAQANVTITAGTYSLGVACIKDTFEPERDADSHLLVAWTSITFDSDGNWSVGEVVPPAGAVDTSTALTATVDGATATTANLVATVAAASGSPAGSVDFFDNITGTPTKLNPSAVTLSGGTASFSATGLAAGAHSFTAVFTPADTEAFNSSTSSAQSLTIVTPKTSTKLELSGTAGASSLTLTAKLETSDGTAITDGTGTVSFTQTDGSLSKTGVAVDTTTSTAVTTFTDLLPGQTYTFTATYLAGTAEGYSDSAATASMPVKLPDAKTDGTIVGNPATLDPGSKYTITFPAGTFGDGDDVTVVLHSDPVTLDPATADAADGSLSYDFTVPTDLEASSSHVIVFTDTTDPTVAAQSVAFIVTAAAEGNSPTGSIITDWMNTTASTPQGMAGLIGTTVLLIAAALGGFGLWFVRRRRSTAQAAAPATEE